jgi:predicted GIY-YIG superfamily endonuclease
MWYVYEIRNQNGKVEYIGETTNPRARKRNHLEKEPVPGWNMFGRFYGRTDLTFRVVSHCYSQEEARAEEDRLKLEHDLPLTENTRHHGLMQCRSSMGGIIVGKIMRDCPYCGRKLKGNGAWNSHLKKCKKEKDGTI